MKSIFLFVIFLFFSCVADIAMDWSDHALWWPARNHWLTRTRSTLDQYGVAADALLHFTPMHKTLRVQLPDTRCIDCRVDFSVKTFNAVINLCKELGKSHEFINIGLKRAIEMCATRVNQTIIVACLSTSTRRLRETRVFLYEDPEGKFSVKEIAV